MEELLDRERFKEWLVAKQGEKVGYSTSAASCPLAAYLEEQGVDRPLVARSNVVALNERGLQVVRLPGWAKRFVKSTDRFTRRAVSAKKALWILKIFGR